MRALRDLSIFVRTGLADGCSVIPRAAVPCVIALTGAQARAVTSAHKLTKLLLRGGLGLLLGLAVVSQTMAQSWEKLTPTGGPPAARSTFSAVSDLTSNRMTIFGGGLIGFPPRPIFGDVWVLEHANGLGGTPNWIELFPAADPVAGSPGARQGHSGVYDPGTNRMIVFGGSSTIGSCSGILNDVWVLTNANGNEVSAPSWIKLNPTGGPPTGRRVHSAVYDANSNRMIMLNGNPNCGSQFSDIWLLKNANGLGGTPEWIQLFPTGVAPPATGATLALYDEANNRLIVAGHVAGGAASTFILEHANGLGGTPNWVTPASNHPLQTAFRGGYDPSTNRVIAFGGSPINNDVWAVENANGLSGPLVWSLLSPTPDPVNGSPLGRQAHTAVFDAPNKRLTIFGGENASIGFNDVWVLGGLGNTPVGLNVAVHLAPEDAGNTAHPVWLTFADVIGAGDTTASVSDTGTKPPLGFRLGTPNIYWTLSTGALLAAESDIEVCLDYTGIAFGSSPENLLLAQTDGGDWFDIKLSVDVATNMICGTTESLSEFAILEVADPVLLLEDMANAVAALNIKKGIANSYDAKLDAVERAITDAMEQNDLVAINVLDAFINAVEAQRGKELSDEEASDLISRAEEIALVLNGEATLP